MTTKKFLGAFKMFLKFLGGGKLPGSTLLVTSLLMTYLWFSCNTYSLFGCFFVL